jgi:hypothetical protein
MSYACDGYIWGSLINSSWGPRDQLMCIPFEKCGDYKLLDRLQTTFSSSYQGFPTTQEDETIILKNYSFSSAYATLYEYANTGESGI